MKYGTINFDPSHAHGKPVFENTSITIQTLFEYLEDGKSLERFLDDYPAINRKNAIEVIQMAKLFITTEKVVKENFPS
jgi:uncharacterized protein (DUF433 family)